MSFSATTGIYTPPTGATNATPGDVIRSATWNTVFGDIALALTQLGQQSFNTKPATVAASPYTVASQDATLIFNVSGTATVVMPTPSASSGRWIRLKTVTSQVVLASASVVAPLTATVVGVTIVSATAGKWAALQCDGTNWVVMAGN